MASPDSKFIFLKRKFNNVTIGAVQKPEIWNENFLPLKGPYILEKQRVIVRN